MYVMHAVYVRPWVLAYVRACEHACVHVCAYIRISWMAVNLRFVTNFIFLFRYRNYFILSEILERVNMSRNTFLRKHNVDLRNLSHTDFIQYLENSGVTHFPDLSSSTSRSKNEVELVFIGSQPLRKILNLKTIKIDY